MYTIADYEEAKVKFEDAADLWSDADIHNKSNKYTARAKAASDRLREIEEYLKRQGIIPYTEHELVEEILNQKYPNAQSREVVEYDGRRYWKEFWPLERSKSGKTVKKWASGWVLLPEKIKY